ncbi:MAG: carboxypeptidase-like regulatory domain-containing protein [Acidobacteriota bacterium]
MLQGTIAKSILCAVAAVVVAPGSAFAQESRGTIAGRVVDPSGAVVPNVEVAAVNLATNTKSTASTNYQGNYLIPYLLPGAYRLTASAAGFKAVTRGSLEVRINDRLQVDIHLELGQSTESVTVTAETPLLQTTNASVGQIIDQRRLSDLPVLHSNPMLLMQLSPAAVSVATNMGFLDTRAGDNARLTEYSIAGTPASTHEVTLDGASNTTTSGGTSARQRTIAFVPPGEIVDEFRIETAAFDASAGATPSGLITINLKSGTNVFHGAARYFKTNPGWNANDFFSNRYGRPRAQLKNYHWVLSGNGPIFIPRVYDGRNRTFFLYGFERQKDDAPWAGGVYSVPPEKQRGGDFSDLLRLGAQYQIYDPATASLVSGRVNRRPFPGNIVPATRISAVARKIMEYYPAPRSAGLADGTQNYPFPDLQLHSTIWSQTGRIDHNITSRQRMFFRAYWGDKNQVYRDYFENLATGLDNQFLNRGATLDHVYAFRPSFVLNVRYSYTRFLFPHVPKSQGMDLSILGFPASFVSQIDRAASSFPQISVNGLSNLGNEKPDLYITNTHHFSSTANWVRGSHMLRFGIDHRVYQENFRIFNEASPRLSFGAAWTQGPVDNSPSSPSGVGQGFAGFLLGLPTGGAVGREANSAVSSPLTGLFIQDDWRVTPKLTLNFGLRYEVEGALTERFNRSVRDMDFTTVNALNDRARANYARNPTPELPLDRFQVKGGLRFSGVGGVPRALFDTGKKNFAPRFGFAYQWNDKTVIRGGYGIFFAFVGQQAGEKVKQYGFSRSTPFQASLDGGLTFVSSLDSPFPGGIQGPVGAADGLNTYLGNSVAFFNPNPRTPYNQRWSLTIQRTLPGAFLLEVGYVGNRAVRLETAVDFRPFDPAFLSRSPVRDQAVIDYWTLRLPNPFYPMLPGTDLAASVITREALVRMGNFPQFTGTTSIENAGSSWYHGFESKLERRFSAGYTVQFGYTWSKYMNLSGRLNGYLSPLEKVIASQDRPHRFTASWIYELPFGPGKKLAPRNRVLSRVAGGWQVQGLTVLQSGPPLGFGNSLLLGSIRDIPLEEGQRTIDRWFNTDVFNRRTVEQLSYNYRALSSLFNGIRADGRAFINGSLIKAIPVRERVNLQFRAELFNAINHPNFSAPNTSPTSTAFATITGTTLNARIIQLGLKLGW